MIPVKNIYHMLSYAFKILQEDRYNQVATEDFEHTKDLCTEILIKGVTQQIKRGLGKEYISKDEVLSSPKGRIHISESIKDMSLFKKQVVCTYDDFSVNTYMNQIIKTTFLLLIRSDIDKARKKKIRNLLMYFSGVDELDIYRVNWNLQYNRNNHTYQMLIGICYLVVNGLLQSTTHGSAKLMNFLEGQQMHRLYEKFLLEYYRKEFPEILVRASQIPWQLDNDMNYMLPIMQTDIMLTYRKKTLIIDAKYYENMTQVNYNKHKVHSGNLYQIFTYVKNKELEVSDANHEVSGMLLYAKSQGEVVPNSEYSMSGNRIAVKTLDLDTEFAEITSQLNTIVTEYLHTPSH